MTLHQAIVWTALPNGWASPGKKLALSVFVAPRLSNSAKPPLLTPFDFANWPTTLSHQHGGALKFSVTFEGHAPITAQLTSQVPDATTWSLIFLPSKTRVDPWKFTDLSGAPLQSFSVTGVEKFVQSFYTAVGTAYPTVFPPASFLYKYLPTDANNHNPPGWKEYVEAAISFHQLPHSLPAGTVHDPRYKPPVPTFDFHATLSALHSYPALMRRLGLVFDLEVTIPGGLSATPKVKVTPDWSPKPTVPGTIDVSPWTACHITGSSFRAKPRGPDYANGMLGLNDSKRFSVVELDTDGAADRVSLLATTMQQTNPPPIDSTHGTPALRSAGLTVIWSGWAERPSKGPGLDLSDLLTNQKANNAQIEAYITSGGTGPLPTFHAEDVIRGHRFDVFTASEATPAWRSLCYRIGTYRLGPKPEHILTIDDEGAVSAALSQPSNLVKYDGRTGAFGAAVPAPPDLYAHERVVRWKGWSLVAQRPGKSGVGSGTQLQENGNNPVPPREPGAIGFPPLLSVTVAAPTTGSQLLPKLRLGDFYRFRARAADLAGNGVDASSPDDTTATAPTPHLRFEPVQSPQLAATKPPVPGEGTQLMVILDDQVHPVPTNGRWIFPPKVSQLMAEEHGMLDGFVEGKPPDPTKPPSGVPATYKLLEKRDPARLNDLPGVKFYGANPNSAGDPGVGSPYFPSATKLTVPWIPDPLSAGVSMVGIPGATDPVVRFWRGVWPDPQPILLVLQAGATAGESYTPATPADSATETITLPPGETAFVAMSSALFPGAKSPTGRLLGLYILGVWQWIAQSGISAKLLSDLETAAVAGLLWELSPFRILELIHAVRIPLAPPTFVAPGTIRTIGSTKAELFDLKFSIDLKSTSSLDVLAAWIDPVDDVAKPAPGLQGHSANAFKLTVDPGFVLGGSAAVQDFGDTHHHLVAYHGVGTSRFNGYFRQTTTVTFSGTTPVAVSTLGLDTASVRLTIPGTKAVDFATDDFVVDAATGTVALTVSGVALAAGRAVKVSWIPTDTLAGPDTLVPVLSTARPIAPTIARVVPAWQLSAPSGSLKSGGILQSRTGNFLRVYLERPWYSSGGGELLGVVTLPVVQLPNTIQQAWTSVVGADPIYDAVFADWGRFTGISSLTNLAPVPVVPGRPAYSNPPELAISEDTGGEKYFIWPYEVQFDPHTKLWFADVQLAFGDQSVAGPDGAYPPMFVRLALTRFQPWSLAGVEVSPVVLATIAQPVPDRVVLVTNGTTAGTVQVQVEGWGYAGWRPAVFNSPGDYNSGISPNQDYPETYGGPTMIVEVQVQDTSTGLSGDFAWKTAHGTRPVMLPSPGDNGAFVSWSGEVPIPGSPAGPLRLCISEIDFYAGATAPGVVDTTYRRPFVCHIPIS